jgi:hypothetical protein
VYNSIIDNKELQMSMTSNLDIVKIERAATRVSNAVRNLGDKETSEAMKEVEYILAEVRHYIVVMGQAERMQDSADASERLCSSLMARYYKTPEIKVAA